MKLFLEVCFKNLYFFLSNASYRSFYKLMLLYGDNRRYQTKQIKISGYTLKVPDVLSFIWQYKEIFVDESYRFQTSNPNPVIIDCGANIGLSALYFKSAYPQSELTCIEADPGIAEILKLNLQKNNKQAEVIAKAAWINNDGVSFSSEGSDSGSISTDGSALIPSLKLNDLLLNYEKIDFLKIDIEGAELSVIPDCTEGLKRVEKMFLEYHSKAGDAQKLDEILRVITNAGFHYYIKTENKRKSPFVNLHKERTYDLQLNIYAYRSK